MSIHIEIGYATLQQQLLRRFSIADGTSVRDAILQSSILSHFPAINLDYHKVGIFGKVVPLSTILTNNDRIEIYRPLMLDPKQARKVRANKILKS